ncbi:MAG: hypothetical protein B6D59_05905 [Campylobacteraceae bacterium 4484_4]|nr:MAG: hypothetical protein B6D59_05905 [Campylobacteraceae bacterium 4484_4]
MGGKSTIIKSFKLAGTKEGTISVSHLEEPYGEDSAPVVSIGISLKGNIDEPDWKAHIPYANLDDLIEALTEAKEKQTKR